MALVDEALLTDIAHRKDLLLAPKGDVQTISGFENYRQALLRRLITTPETLVHRPTYGVGIKDFQNAPSSIANQRKLALRIKEQFEQDPRTLSVEGFKFDVDDNTPEKITIFVKVTAIGFGEVELPFQPFGEVS